MVSWDPVENTVLANEQVDAGGRSWRSGAIVEKRELEQWFLHITEFKESLLRDLKKLGENDAWPEQVLTMQKNWLGRSEGAYYRFPASPAKGEIKVKNFEIFTTRPETIFAAQFLAISPSSHLADELAKEDPDLRKFLSRAKTLPHDSTEGYRLSQVKAINPLSLTKGTEENGFEPLPIYVAPYVRGDYETAAVMGVPAHDARDFGFWKRHCPNDPIKYTITTDKNVSFPDGTSPIITPGYMTSLAGEYQGRRSEDVAKQVVAKLNSDKQLAKGTVKWKLRDWLISRQRYWGTPIPIIHCNTCGAQPVPDDQLPVKLPKVGYHWADGRTGNPLETATDWINTTCPKCHGPAKRDTDTMDTFMDSSWYYMRFPDPHNPSLPISEEAAKQHLPVDIYVGGVEHAILHLLYSRFIYKAVMGLLYPNQSGTTKKNTGIEALDRKAFATQLEQEPFKRLVTQEMVYGKTYKEPDSGRYLKPDEIDLSDPSSPKITASGRAPSVSFEKMSKSKYNGVDPGSFISKYGADATRAHILFQAAVGDVLNWDEVKISGIVRWLRRVYDLAKSLASAEKSTDWDAKQHFSKDDGKDHHLNAARYAVDSDVWRLTQNTIISVTSSMEKVYTLNTAISDLMNLTNALFKAFETASEPVMVAATAHLLKMMAPMAPAVAEECWSMLYSTSSSSSQNNIIFEQQPNNKKTWPVPDGTLSLLRTETVKCGVMVNGRLRCEVEIPADRPADVQDGPDFERWVTGEILKSPEAQGKLTEGALFDIRKAKKMFFVKGGKSVSYVI